MRILFSGITLHPEWPGGEPIVAREIGRQLQRMGEEVGFFETLSIRRHLSIPIISYMFSLTTDIDPFVYAKYCPTFKAFSPHAILAWFDQDTTPILASRSLGIPIVAAVHCYWPVCHKNSLWLNDVNEVCNGCCFETYSKHCSISLYSGVLSRLAMRGLHERIERFKNIDAIIVPSNFVKKKLVKSGFCEEKIFVIYNGVDLTLFSPSLSQQDVTEERRIIFVGGREEMKGITHFAKLAKDLEKKHKNLSFIAVGRKPNRPIDLQYTGYLSTEQLIKLYSSAYCIVIPSLWYEPASLVAIEAMAMKKPVVAYASGGLIEMVKNGNTGFLVERGNLNEFEHAVEILLSNEDLAKKMGESGRKRVENFFNLKDVGARYLKVIKKCV